MTDKKQTKGWTPERRAAQAERCRQTKPWTKATGPKTPRGKARSSINAMKHGGRCRRYKRLDYMLWLNKQFCRVALMTFTDMGTKNYFPDGITNEMKEAIKKYNEFNDFTLSEFIYNKRTEERLKLRASARVPAPEGGLNSANIAL